MPTGGDCGDQWRVESCNARTGATQRILHPISFSFETVLNQFGQGSMTLATKDVRSQDLIPNVTQLNFLRIAGGNATPDNPVCEFIALVEKFGADDAGTTTVGFKHIADYMNRRSILVDANGNTAPAALLSFDNVDQNTISLGIFNSMAMGVAAINSAAAQLSPPLPPFAWQPAALQAIALPGQYRRARSYNIWEHKNVGEALMQLSQVINGNDWSYQYTRALTSGGFYIWTCTLVFQDYVGVTRNTLVRSDREAAGYKLDVDGSKQANYVYATGSGMDVNRLTAIAYDSSGNYPLMEATAPFVDISVPATLQDHASGYITQFADAIAQPEATLHGFDIDPASLLVGDTVTVQTSYGAVSYNAPARIQKIAWSVAGGQAAQRVLTFLPTTNTLTAVLGAPPQPDPCVGC